MLIGAKEQYTSKNGRGVDPANHASREATQRPFQIHARRKQQQFLKLVWLEPSPCRSDRSSRGQLLKDENCDFIFDDEWMKSVNCTMRDSLKSTWKQARTNQKIKDYVHEEAMGLLGDAIQDIHKLGLGYDSFDCRYELKGVEFARERVYVEWVGNWINVLVWLSWPSIDS